MQLPMVVTSCSCRICKSQYDSLLEATSCCKKEKALDRLARMDTQPILKKGVKFKSHQAKLGEFHHHEIAWRELLSALYENGKSD